ncbi:hypothetical protein RJ639_041471, partial [Escallonia herrerae]
MEHKGKEFNQRNNNFTSHIERSTLCKIKSCPLHFSFAETNHSPPNNLNDTLEKHFSHGFTFSSCPLLSLDHLFCCCCFFFFFSFVKHNYYLSLTTNKNPSCKYMAETQPPRFCISNKSPEPQKPPKQVPDQHTPLLSQLWRLLYKSELWYTPQTMPFVMDTGSSLVWFPCTNLYAYTNCNFPNINPANISTFIPKLSSSARILGCKNPECGLVFDPEVQIRCKPCHDSSGNCTDFCPPYIVHYGSGSTAGQKRISVGGKHVKIPPSFLKWGLDGSGGTILDSGTTFTYMDLEVFNLVAREFEKQMSHYSRAADVEIRSGLMPCFYASEQKMAKDSGTNFFILAVCMTIVRDNAVGSGVKSGPSIIIRNIQQQNFYLEYDLENERLGFRQQVCNRNLFALSLSFHIPPNVDLHQCATLPPPATTALFLGSLHTTHPAATTVPTLQPHADVASLRQPSTLLCCCPAPPTVASPAHV